MVYLIILIYILLLTYYYDIKGRENLFSFHYWFLFLIISSISGLSYRLGIDVIRYESTFNWLMPQFSAYHFFGNEMFQSSHEPIWLFLNVFVKQVFGSFVYVKLIIALFVNGTIFWFLRKHSPAFFFSILLYFVFPFFGLNFQVLRESIAISFFLIALDNIIGDNRNYLKYYLWLIPTMLSHHFGFVMLLVPLLFYIKRGKVFWIVALILIIVSPYINNAFGFLTEMDVLDEGISQKMEIYLNAEKYSRPGLRIVSFINNLFINILPFLLIYSYCKKYDSKIMSLALCYILIKFMNIIVIGILYRFTNYFAIPAIVIMASGFREIAVEKSYHQAKIAMMRNNIFASLVVLFLLTCGIYNKLSSTLWPMYYPYASVITSNTDEKREALYSSVNE